MKDQTGTSTIIDDWLSNTLIDQWLSGSAEEESTPIVDHNNKFLSQLEEEKLHLQQELAQKQLQCDQNLEQELINSQHSTVEPLKHLVDQIEKLALDFSAKEQQQQQDDDDDIHHMMIQHLTGMIQLLSPIEERQDSTMDSDNNMSTGNTSWKDTLKRQMLYEYVYCELLRDRLCHQQLSSLLDPVLALHNTSTSTGGDSNSGVSSGTVQDYFAKNKNQLNKISAMVTLLFQMEMILNPVLYSLGILKSSDKQVEETSDDNGGEEYLVTRALVEPFIVRFKYHFYGKRATNRLDSSEYCFTYMTKILEHYGPFIEQVILPLYYTSLSTVRPGDFDDRVRDPLNGFIYLLNLELARKVLHVLSPALKLILSDAIDAVESEEGSSTKKIASTLLFLNTINQVLAFDVHMKSIYSYVVSQSVMDILLMDKNEGEIVLNQLIQLDLSSSEKVLSTESKQWEPLSSSSLILAGGDMNAGNSADYLPLLQEWKPSVYAYTLVHTIQSLNQRYRTIGVHYRIELFRRVNLELIETFLKSTEKFVAMKRMGDVNENRSQWIKHATVLNSVLYVSTHLRDMSELDFIVEMIPYLKNVGVYDILADQCDISSTSMMNNLVRVIMDRFNLHFDKYLYDNDVDYESYVDKIIKNLNEQLTVLKQYIQTNSFYVITRRLLTDVDSSLFAILKNKSKYSREIQDRIIKDLSLIVHSVFDPYVMNAIPIMIKSGKMLQ